LQVVERSEEEDYVLAHMDSIVEDDPIYTTLGSGDNRSASDHPKRSTQRYEEPRNIRGLY
jgi:hypothetical protein